MYQFILPKEVSIVVQGPIIKNSGPENNTNSTKSVLKSIRSCIPEAEIILSTWLGSDIVDLDYDQLVMNSDPGSWDFLIPTKGQNFHRQFVSTSRGLSLVTRKYAAKLRSDTLLENSGFLKFADDSPSRDWLRIFSDRVAISAYSCFDPRSTQTLFHPSDLFFFGRSNDLRMIFPVEQDSYHWIDSPISPEQILWLSALRRKGIPIRLKWHRDFSIRLCRLSERALISNFNVIHPTDLGLLLPRRLYKLAEMCYDPALLTRLRVQFDAHPGFHWAKWWLEYLAGLVRF